MKKAPFGEPFLFDKLPFSHYLQERNSKFMTKMETVKNVVRRAMCLPLYLGTLVALVVHALWGEKTWWIDGVLFTELKVDSWPNRTWYKGWGGTTFGYGIMLAPNQAESVSKHELVHVEQGEASVVGGIFTGLLAVLITHSIWSVPLFFFCWITSWWMAYLGSMVAALLRGEKSAYRGSHLEEAAYSIADQNHLKSPLD